MKVIRKQIARHILVLLGIIQGVECQGLSISSSTARTRENIRGIEHAIDIYALEHDNKPPDSLDVLIRPARNNSQPLLEKELLTDSWGEPIEYVLDGHQYIIRSSGADRAMGTADDIIQGYPPAYVDEAKRSVRETPAVVRQKTNAVQAATGETAQPTAGVGKVTTKRVPVTFTQSPAETDEPAKEKTAPWKILLLIGGTVLGAMAAWRCFRKKT